MLLFKRLFSFKQGALGWLLDKRKATRYPIGAGFPLKATVNLTGSTAPASVGRGCDWAGQLADFSSVGARLQLPPAAVAVRGEPTVLRLTLEGHAMQVPCKVAHFRTYHSHSFCGLTLQFEDKAGQKAYLQLFETVVTGSSFAPCTPTGYVRNPPGLIREQYKSHNGARLSAWRDAKSRKLASFEFVMGDHGVKGRAGVPVLEIYTRQKTDKPLKVTLSAPELSLLPGAHEEIRRFFKWMVPNLAKVVPADLRALMSR